MAGWWKQWSLLFGWLSIMLKALKTLHFEKESLALKSANARFFFSIGYRFPKPGQRRKTEYIGMSRGQASPNPNSDARCHTIWQLATLNEVLGSLEDPASSPAAAWVAAMAWVQSTAHEFPHAWGVAKKTQLSPVLFPGHMIPGCCCSAVWNFLKFMVSEKAQGHMTISSGPSVFPQWPKS